jgi:FMN phosphatase YigB (HAD superfamily)
LLRSRQLVIQYRPRRSVRLLADAYSVLHDEELSLLPDAHETLDRLNEFGVKLALITNGAAAI